jgi:hypothetical protein
MQDICDHNDIARVLSRVQSIPTMVLLYSVDHKAKKEFIDKILKKLPSTAKFLYVCTSGVSSGLKYYDASTPESLTVSICCFPDAQTTIFAANRNTFMKVSEVSVTNDTLLEAGMDEPEKDDWSVFIVYVPYTGHGQRQPPFIDPFIKELQRKYPAARYALKY